ncbi:MAG: heme NO-binding domain-containing protein [Actinomycetota bacterium]
MVNRAIKDLVLDVAGEDVWLQICEDAGLTITSFTNTAVYDDATTYDLVGAASRVLGMDPEAVLERFGRHWILFTGQEGWGPLFDIAGDDFRSFVRALDAMHARVQASLPDCRMPSFVVEDTPDGGLRVEYRSDREGLAPMVIGLFRGLAEYFSEDWGVEQTSIKSTDGADRFLLQPLTAAVGQPSERLGTV